MLIPHHGNLYIHTYTGDLKNFSPEVEVLFWKHRIYLNPRVDGPLWLIQFNSILSQAFQLTIKLTNPHPDGYDSDADELEAAPLVYQLIWLMVGHTLVCINYLM